MGLWSFSWCLAGIEQLCLKVFLVVCPFLLSFAREISWGLFCFYLLVFPGWLLLQHPDPDIWSKNPGNSLPCPFWGPKVLSQFVFLSLPFRVFLRVFSRYCSYLVGRTGRSVSISFLVHSFFFSWSNILLYRSTTICLSDYLLMHVWTDSSFWLWTWFTASINVHRQVFVWAYVFISRDKHLGVELLSHMVIVCLTLQETVNLFSRAVVPFSFPTSNAQLLSFLASICHWQSFKF